MYVATEGHAIVVDLVDFREAETTNPPDRSGSGAQAINDAATQVTDESSPGRR
jgi:hypothetical protein